MIQKLYENGKINNEVEAYLLGFFYADGYIAYKDKKRKNYHMFGITLSKKDEDFLNKIADILSVKTKIRKTTANGGKYEVVELKIFNVEFVRTLMRLGIKPRKTYENDADIIDNVPSHLLNHFIRGFFDGDGSVWKQKNKNYGIGIVSLNKKLLEKIEQAFFTSDDRRIKHKKICLHRNKYHRLSYIGNKVVVCIGNFLYGNNSTLFLPRKKQMFDQILQAT